MTGLLGAEWLKLRRRWMPRVLLLILLVIEVLLFWGIGTNSGQRDDLLLPRGWLMGLLLSVFVAPFLWPILAGSWAGAEYGWGTIRLVLSRRPDRVQFALAGLLTLLGAVVVAQVAVLIGASAASIVVAALTGHAAFNASLLTAHFVGTLLKGFLVAWYVLAFFVAVAYAFGTVFRSSAVGIGTGIGFTLAENILRGILVALGGTWREIALHLPGVYVSSLSSRVMQEGLSRASVNIPADAPGIGESVLVFGLYILVPLVVTAVLVLRRDVTA